MDRRKLIWGFCFILSLLYLVLFIIAAWSRPDGSSPPFGLGDGLTDGFCVWDFPPPHDRNKDHCEALNSHSLAWYVDISMAFFTICLFLFRGHSKVIQPNIMLLYGGFALVILFHGLLHRWIASMGCFLPIGVGGDAERIGMIVYFLYTFMLCMLLFFIGLPKLGFMKHAILAGGVAVLTLIITKNITPQFSLSTLFVITHPLSSCVAYFSDGTLLTSSAGIFFALATLAGLVELAACATIEMKLLGHVWYDLLLHISMMMSLPVTEKKAVVAQRYLDSRKSL